MTTADAATRPAEDAATGSAALRPVGSGVRRSRVARFESSRRADLGLLLAVGAVGLVGRLIFAPSAPIFLEGDSQSYLLPGWELANGSGFSPELRRAPFYPLFIATVLRLLGPNLELLAMVQHALGLATALLACLLGQRIFGRLAGLLAGLAVALSGPQLIYEHYLMSEALFGLLLTGASLAMVVALATGWPTVAARTPFRGPALVSLLAGGLLGLCALTRPVAQALLPLFLAACLLLLPRWRPALRTAGLALLGYLLVAAPWTLRNLATHDAATAAGGLGRSLIARTVKYDSLFDWKWLSETHEQRDDLPAQARMLLYRKRGNIPASRSVRPYQDALIRELGLSQAQAEAQMREIAVEAIQRRPLDYLRGSLLFSGQLFLGREESFVAHWKQRATKDWDEQWDDRLDPLVTSATPGMLEAQPAAAGLVDLYQPSRFAWLLGILALIGCITAGVAPARRPALLLAAVVLPLLALGAFLDGPVARYRYPLDPLIAVLAAGGLVGIVAAARTRSGRAW